MYNARLASRTRKRPALLPTHAHPPPPNPHPRFPLPPWLPKSLGEGAGEVMQALGRTFPAVARASGIAAARAASAPVSAALFRSGFGGLNQGVPVANHLCQGQWGRRAMATGKKDADLVGKAKKGSVTTIDSKTVRAPAFPACRMPTHA